MWTLLSMCAAVGGGGGGGVAAVVIIVSPWHWPLASRRCCHRHHPVDAGRVVVSSLCVHACMLR